MAHHLKLDKETNEILEVLEFSGTAPDAQHLYALIDSNELTKLKIKHAQGYSTLYLSDIVQGKPIIIPHQSQVPAPKVVKVAPAKPATAKAKSSKAETAKMLGNFMRASKRSSK